MSDSEHSDDEGPSEAEIAMKKRAAKSQVSSSGLDEAAKELLEHNKEEREKMEEEISELKARNEKRKKERAIEEKRLAAERSAEEERRKAAEEEKRRKKDEEDQKKQGERAKKLAEFEKYKNPSKPNFVISAKKSEGGEDEEEEGQPGRKSKEQLEAEKRAILQERIGAPIQITGLDKGKLTDKAKELHKVIVRLEGEKYDLEKRFKLQQVDMMELAERARQANKVGKGGLKRIQGGEDEVDMIQARFAGTPSKVEMYSKYERQKDKREYSERKTLYTGPQFLYPAERIKQKRIVKWAEGGLPIYEDIPGADEEAPAAAVEE